MADALKMGASADVRPVQPAPPSRAELAVLCALLFFVPLFEVPKQLLWLAWVILWIAARGPRALLAQPRTPSEWALCAVAASALTAGLFSGHWWSSIADAGDPIRVVSIAWLLARGGYRPRQLAVAFGAALSGTLVALGWGVVSLMRADEPAYLQLHSVGHVNHSAIYLAIAMSGAVGLLLAQWRANRLMRAALAAAALALLVSLFVGASRAALGAAGVFLVALAWAAPLDAASAGEPPPRRWAFRAALAAMLLGGVLVYGVFQQISPRPLQPSGEGFVEKFRSRPAEAGVLSFRDRLWRVAVLGFASSPGFGIGNGQFGSLSARTLCPQDGAQPPTANGGVVPRAPGDGAVPPDGAGTELPDPCDASRLYFAPHAHSLYANVLAERGAFGLLAIIGLLGVWAWLLVRSVARFRGDDLRVGLWCASLGGWCVTALAGLLNTTLHHEHGMLSMFALGALLSVAACTTADSADPGTAATAGRVR